MQRTLCVLTAGLLAPAVALQEPQAAQDPKADPAPEEIVVEMPEMPVIEWDGLAGENIDVDDSDLEFGDRAVAPHEKALEQFFRLNETYVKFVEDNLKGFDGSKGQREAAFQGVNLVMVTGVVWPPTLGALGGTIGAVVGGTEGSIVPGAGTAAGVALGGGVGVAAGGTVGTGAMTMQLLLAVKLAMDVNDKYPDVASRDVEMAEDEDWMDPDEWVIEDLLEELTGDPAAVEASAGNGEATEGTVEDRGGRRRRARSTSRISRSSGYAGPWESLFIHSVSQMVGPEIDKLVRHWDRMPGLTRGQKAQLAQATGLRKVLQNLNYIRANQRLRGGRKAMPLSTWQQRVTKLLRADQGAVQQVWLDAFGLANTKISVNGSKVSWQTPRSLRNLGAPSSFGASLPAMSARVKGFGGSLSARLTPGRFDIALRSSQIQGDRIRVNFKIRKGRLFTVKVKGSLGPAKQNLASFRPRLTRDLTGSIDFKLQGYGVVVDRVRLGKLDLSVGMPKLPAVLGPLQPLVSKIEKKIKSEIGNAIAKGIGWNSLFRDLQKYAPRELLNILNRSADDYGLSSISRLRSLRLNRGRLEAQVEAMAWGNLPAANGLLQRYQSVILRLAR